MEENVKKTERSKNTAAEITICLVKLAELLNQIPEDRVETTGQYLLGVAQGVSLMSA